MILRLWMSVFQISKPILGTSSKIMKKLINRSQFYYKFNKFKVFSPFICRKDRHILNKRKIKGYIIISCSDKGVGAVMLNKSHHTSKITNLLYTTSNFTPSNTSIFKHILHIENKINHFLRSFKQKFLLPDHFSSIIFLRIFLFHSTSVTIYSQSFVPPSP